MFASIKSAIAAVTAPAVVHAVSIPSGGKWPFWKTIAKWVGEIQFGAIILFVLFLIASICVFAAGKINDNPGMKSKGTMGMVVSLIGVAFVASAPALITYFSGVKVA